ncbi:divalent metal cation transporter [Streptomyces sp. NPDC059697]|uniref:divalent metal cation transporter n=1 Tax=Streptomyces sp. NPDC059697 TaxID=3346912 RepID=UPI0036D0B062
MRRDTGSAGAVVPLSASYAIGEAAGVERSVSRSFRDAPLFLGLFTAQMVLGATVAMTPADVIQLLIGTQVLQGLISPIVLVYLLVLTNRRSVLGTAANTPRYRIAASRPKVSLMSSRPQSAAVAMGVAVVGGATGSVERRGQFRMRLVNMAMLRLER